jgi:hypothetical protein
MIRRTSWRHYHHDQLAIAASVADWMAVELHWSDEQKQAQLAAYHTLCGAPIASPDMLIRGSSANGHASPVGRQAIEAG